MQDVINGLSWVAAGCLVPWDVAKELVPADLIGLAATIAGAAAWVARTARVLQVEAIMAAAVEAVVARVSYCCCCYCRTEKGAAKPVQVAGWRPWMCCVRASSSTCHPGAPSRICCATVNPAHSN